MSKNPKKECNRDKKRRIYISVTLTDDEEVRALNKKYLNRDCPTDVLSFNIDEKMEAGGLYLGDVVVNRDQAERQAKKVEKGVEKEISELTAHGILHLLGVHHEKDEK
jgi:probable rRNA maturation factor